MIDHCRFYSQRSHDHLYIFKLIPPHVQLRFTVNVTGDFSVDAITLGAWKVTLERGTGQKAKALDRPYTLAAPRTLSLVARGYTKQDHQRMWSTVAVAMKHSLELVPAAVLFENLVVIAADDASGVSPGSADLEERHLSQEKGKSGAGQRILCIPSLGLAFLNNLPALHFRAQFTGE
jgi:hypothetical protein